MAKTATRKTPKSETSKLASEIRHLEGCPAERLEEYEAKRPESAGGDVITVARCIECGASNVE